MRCWSGLQGWYCSGWSTPTPSIKEDSEEEETTIDLNIENHLQNKDKIVNDIIVQCLL
jgi:hypothetical protein